MASQVRWTFSSVGTRAFAAHVAATTVELVGPGGGGGGGGATYGGGGGGGGAYASSVLTLTPGSSYNVVLPASGAGGVGGTTPVAGTAAADATFDTTQVVADGGGGGGPGQALSGGTGGTGGTTAASTGTTKIAGAAGAAGGLAAGGAGGLAPAVAYGHGGAGGGTLANGSAGIAAVAVIGWALTDATAVATASVTYRVRITRAATAKGAPAFTRSLRLFREQTATAKGAPAKVLRLRVARSRNADGTTSGRIELPIDRIPSAGGTPDWPVTSATKAIAGNVIHHETAAVIVGADVHLFRDSDDKLVQSTVSAADGSYSFARDAADPYTYYVAAQVDGGTQVHGISDRGLVPA